MIKFIEYNDEFLNLSWKWLNDKEIKELTSTSDFTKLDQKYWFENLRFKEDYYIKGIMINNIKIGVVGLKNITTTSGEYWGYIGEKKYWGQGIGKLMLKYIEEFSVKRNLEMIYLKVNKNNMRAIKLYLKQNYRVYKEESQFFIFKKILKIQIKY